MSAQHAAGDAVHRPVQRIEADEARPSGFRLGDLLLREGQPRRLYRLSSGWASEERVLANGRRQIVHLALPGDIIGFGEKNGLAILDVVALTRGVCTLLPEASSDLADMRIAMAARQAALVDHLVRLGQLSAIERAAQLFLSLYERLAAAGLVSGRAMPMPLNQTQLGDHLGISPVHVNRTLQQLRRDGLLEVRNGRAVLRDVAALAAMCDHRGPDGLPAGSGRPVLEQPAMRQFMGRTAPG